MYYWQNGVKHKIPEKTAEELAQMEDANQRAKAEENLRSLSSQEATDVLLKALVNNVDIPDQTSVRMMDYYPAFDTLIGKTLKQGYKLTYGGNLYKTAQIVTVQDIYKPGDTGTESLYTRIDIDHLGNKYDPIPYAGNMELFSGKYYSQDGVLYLCNRDIGAAVVHPLAELVRLYVEKA